MNSNYIKNIDGWIEYYRVFDIHPEWFGKYELDNQSKAQFEKATEAFAEDAKIIDDDICALSILEQWEIITSIWERTTDKDVRVRVMLAVGPLEDIIREYEEDIEPYIVDYCKKDHAFAINLAENVWGHTPTLYRLRKLLTKK